MADPFNTISQPMKSANLNYWYTEDIYNAFT